MNILLLDTTQTVIVIFVIIAIFAILCLALFIVYKNSSKALYRKYVKTYEQNHTLLFGEITKILKRIQIISSNNSSYKDKYALLAKNYLDAKENDANLAQIIKKLKELIDQKNHREFKSVLKSNTQLINKYNKIVEYLNTELQELIKLEMDFKKEESALFDIFNKIKEDYNKKADKYSYVDASFRKLFEAVEHQFVKVDERLDYADYDEVKEILSDIKKILSDLPTIAKELPEIIERVTKTIPPKIKQLEKKYKELIEKEFPLSYLNIEETIDVMRNALVDIDNQIKDLTIKGINQTLDNIESRIDELINTLIEEERAKQEFDEIYTLIIVNVNKTDQEYAALKANIDRFEKIYQIDKDHQTKLLNLKTLVDKMDMDKRNIELQLHYNGQTPYSYLINVAKGLDENATKTSELLSEIKTYQLASKEICEKAYSLLEPTYHKIKLIESKINSLLQPQVEERYKTSIERTYIVIENINRSINNIPIDVKTVEELTNELSSIHEKIFVEIDTMLEYQEKARDAILVINRDRMNYSDINSLLIQAEKHYNQGEYKLAFDLTTFILEKLRTRLPKSKKVKKIK